MPFPIAIVGAVIGGAVIGGAAKALHDEHSDYSDYSAYSDAAERRRREEEAKEKNRLKNLELARRNMQETLLLVRSAMIEAAGPNADNIFKQWNIREEMFSYKDFINEYSKLDKAAQQRISKAVSCLFDETERVHQKSLDDVNMLIKKISEYRLTEK